MCCAGGLEPGTLQPRVCLGLLRRAPSSGDLQLHTWTSGRAEKGHMNGACARAATDTVLPAGWRDIDRLCRQRTPELKQQFTAQTSIWRISGG